MGNSKRRTVISGVITVTLLYSPYWGRANAVSAMVLYRMASYVFPFLVSIPFVFHFRRSVQNRKANNRSLQHKRKIL